MTLAEQILNRRNEINRAVFKAPDRFLLKIIESPRNWDADIVATAAQEWTRRTRVDHVPTPEDRQHLSSFNEHNATKRDQRTNHR